MELPNEGRGGRLEGFVRRPQRFMASPILGANSCRDVLVEYAAIWFVFTKNAASDEGLIDAAWAKPTIIQRSRIYARTNDLVVVTPYDTLIAAVEDLATMLPFKRASGSVGVNLDAVREVDHGGLFGRLGFVVKGAHGQDIATEWIGLSRNGGRGIFGDGGFCPRGAASRHPEQTSGGEEDVRTPSSDNS